MRKPLAVLLIVCAFPGAAEPQDYQRELKRCGIEPKPRLPLPVEAIEACTAVIDSGKATPGIVAQALVNRGKTYRMRHDDTDRALADYDQAIRMMPDFEPAFVARGFVYLFARPDPDRAIADFSEAIRLDPASFAVFYLRGLAWSRKGDWDRAIADFDQTIRLRPTYDMAYRDRGMAKQAKSDTAGAAADLAEADRIGREGLECGGGRTC
jgi:tetratricopeptide (TPR) repeat protein